jgi:hypothetical protein
LKCRSKYENLLYHLYLKKRDNLEIENVWSLRRKERTLGRNSSLKKMIIGILISKYFLLSDCIALDHCGSAKVCFKCWVDTLVETSPFCRNEVMGGQLKCAPSTSPKNKPETQSPKKKESVSAVL